jgi:hypothetical protein
MSPDQVPRSLEERVTRLEVQNEHRGAAFLALVAGVIVCVYLLQAAGLLKVDLGGAGG